MEYKPRSALSRLVNGLRREQHDYRPSLEVFPVFNVDKIGADMGLAQAGARRGAGDEPSTDSSALDDIESRII